MYLFFSALPKEDDDKVYFTATGNKWNILSGWVDIAISLQKNL